MARPRTSDPTITNKIIRSVNNNERYFVDYPNQLIYLVNGKDKYVLCRFNDAIRLFHQDGSKIKGV